MLVRPGESLHATRGGGGGDETDLRFVSYLTEEEEEEEIKSNNLAENISPNSGLPCGRSKERGGSAWLGWGWRGEPKVPVFGRHRKERCHFGISAGAGKCLSLPKVWANKPFG